MTRRPWININDVLSGVDRASHSISECIELTEAALCHPNDLACQSLFGFRNNSTIYSDQIRLSMESLRVSNLVEHSVHQVRSEVVLGPEAEYKEVLFTHPPNPANSPD
jgi:hypothetical protein